MIKKHLPLIVIIALLLTALVAIAILESPAMILNLLNPLLMIGIPAGLWLTLARAFKPGWRLLLIGALTFILSQVFHLPFNALALSPLIEAMGWQMLPGSSGLLLVSILLGLSAGLFENIARYLALRYWAKGARSWEQGVMFGAGHGGGEAIILGIITLLTFFRFLALRGVDLSTVFPADQVPIAQAQLDAYWNSPWYFFLLAPLERVWAICLHIFATLLVVRAINRRNLAWLGAAILMHSFLDAFAVFVNTTWGAVAAEAGITLLGLVFLALIFRLRRDMPALSTDLPVEPPTQPEIIDTLPRAVTPTSEQIDDSRFG